MSDVLDLREKILVFRVHELQLLLRFAGCVKYGKKKDLQVRAIDQLELNPDLLRPKVLELFTERYHEKLVQVQCTPKSIDPSSLSFKENPFFKVISELIGPTILRPTFYAEKGKQLCLLDFKLTMEQCNLLSKRRYVEYDSEVHLKFCMANFDGKFETLPYCLAVAVNGAEVKLGNSSTVSNPGAELRKKNEHVDCTMFLRLSPLVRNVIKINWIPEPVRVYGLIVQLVARLQSTDLIHGIAAREILPSVTRNMIIKLMASGDDDLSTTTIKAALKCPLGRERIKMPCRGLSCTHVGCFDGMSFLQLNEKKDSFVCPLCNKSLRLEEICSDMFFSEILANASPGCSEVQFNKDGTWFEIETIETKQMQIELIDLVDSDSDDNDNIPVVPCKIKYEPSSPKMPPKIISTHIVEKNKTGSGNTFEEASSTERNKVTPKFSHVKQHVRPNLKELISSVPTMVHKNIFPKSSQTQQNTSTAPTHVKQLHHLSSQDQVLASLSSQSQVLASLSNQSRVSASLSSQSRVSASLSSQSRVSASLSSQSRVSASLSSQSHVSASFSSQSRVSASLSSQTNQFQKAPSSRNDHIKRPRLGDSLIRSSTPSSKRRGHSASVFVSTNRPTVGSPALARRSQTSVGASSAMPLSIRNTKGLNLSKNVEPTPAYVDRFAGQSSASMPGSNQLSQQYPPMPPLSALPALLHQNSVGFQAPTPTARMYSSKSESPYIYPQVMQTRPPPLTFLPYGFPYYTQPLQFFDGHVPGLPNIYSFMPTAAMLQNLQNVYSGGTD